MVTILGMNLRDWRLRLMILAVVVCLCNVTSADEYEVKGYDTLPPAPITVDASSNFVYTFKEGLKGKF